MLDVSSTGGIREVCSWYSRDALYDCAWSEENENHLVSSSGDGSIKLWDTRQSGQPVRSWEEHTAEAPSVDWNVVVRALDYPLNDIIPLFSYSRPFLKGTFYCYFLPKCALLTCLGVGFCFLEQGTLRDVLMGRYCQNLVTKVAKISENVVRT